MKKLFIFIFFGLFFISINGQVKKDTVDLKYLEDQIYLALTYNLLFELPGEISQNGFSGGASVGFIKDIPFNKNRDVGIGLGIGYSYNTYIQNLKISENNINVLFETAEDYKTNRFGISAIELPFELRWRNSTPEKYKFWRVYTGIKFSYILSVKTIYSDLNQTLRTKNIDAFNRFQYGLTLATGYSTWNLYVYYGLKPLFNDVLFKGKKLDIFDVNIGLKFYIM
jgi:hypothetical protein